MNNKTEYKPQFFKNDSTTILLSNLFTYKQCILYAKEHNLDVLFTETTACNSVEIIVSFIDHGFSHEFIKEKVFSADGLYLGNRIYCKFCCKQKKHKVVVKKVKGELVR